MEKLICPVCKREHDIEYDYDVSMYAAIKADNDCPIATVYFFDHEDFKDTMKNLIALAQEK